MSDCRSCLAKAWSIICLLTVEPALFLASLGNGFYETTTRVLTFDKVCIMLLDDVDLCVSRNFTSEQEILVQQRASIWEFYRMLTSNLPAIFLIVIYSNLIDRWSKKYTMLLCPIGYIINSVIYLVCAIYIASSPGYMLIGSTILGLSGGILTMMGACFSYQSATVTPGSLIIHLSLAEAALLASSAISSFASGILLEAVGAVIVYIIIIVNHVLLILYILIFLKNISLAATYAQSNHVTIIQSKQEDSDNVESANALKAIQSNIETEIASNQASDHIHSDKISEINYEIQNGAVPSIDNAAHATLQLDTNSSFKENKMFIEEKDYRAVNGQLSSVPTAALRENGSIYFADTIDPAEEGRSEVTSDVADLVSNDSLERTSKTKSHSRRILTILKGALVMSVIYMKDYVNTAARRRPHNKRRGIVAILVILLIFIPCVYAVWNGLCYLFVTQEPLSWSTATYGYFVGVLRGVKGFCLLVILPLFKRLNVPYTVIIVISLVSSSIASAAFSVSIYTWMAFLSAVLDLFETALVVTSRSLIVNFVEDDEHGKAFGMVASLECLAFVLSGAIFNLGIYPATVHIFAGTAILTAALILIFPLAIAIWLHFFMRKMSHIPPPAVVSTIIQ